MKKNNWDNCNANKQSSRKCYENSQDKNFLSPSERVKQESGSPQMARKKRHQPRSVPSNQSVPVGL